MRERPLSSPTFPAAHCDACGVTVLTHLAVDSTGMTTRLCVACDRPVTAALEWLSAERLAETGHQLETPRRAGGCGGGCGCSTRGN